MSWFLTQNMKGRIVPVEFWPPKTTDLWLSARVEQWVYRIKVDDVEVPPRFPCDIRLRLIRNSPDMQRDDLLTSVLLKNLPISSSAMGFWGPCLILFLVHDERRGVRRFLFSNDPAHNYAFSFYDLPDWTLSRNWVGSDEQNRIALDPFTGEYRIFTNESLLAGASE